MFQYELNTENQRGMVKDAAKVESLEKKIAELKAELDKPEVDPVIARGEEEIELFGVPLGAYFTTIADHVAVRSVVISAFRQLIQEKKDIEEGYNKLSEASEAESQRLSEIIEAKDTEIATLKAALYESKLQAEDHATKRDNAYAELLEAKKTIDELNDKIAAATAPKTPARTNLDGAETVKKEKRVIHSVVYEGKWNEQFKAILADTEEEIKDYTLYKDIKYTEVTAEKAIPFRTEYLAAQQSDVSDEDHSYDIPDQNSDATTEEVTYTAPAFRGEEESTEGAAAGLVAETSTMAGSTVTREEFEELKAEFYDVKSRFAALESIREVA